MNLEEKLTTVGDTFAALIAADAYFAGIPVATERKGDIGATIRDALAKLGLSVAVVVPDGDTMKRQGDTLQMRVRVVAQISELYLVNQGATGSRKPALAAAVRVMKAVDRKPNGLDPAGTQHRPGLNEFELPTEQPFKLSPDPKFIVYHVTAYTTVNL